MLIDEILQLKVIEEIARMKEVPNDQWRAWYEPWMKALPEVFGAKAAAEGA
jgi:hypothetical protein